MNSSGRIRLCLAAPADRDDIYALRYEVYSRELGQHPDNALGRLQDSLDDRNIYIVARCDDEVVGFVSVTPPGGAFSLEKYIERTRLPFPADEHTYEVRLLTVPEQHRGGGVAGMLAYAAFRWVEANGGRNVIGMGRRELMPFYRKIGLEGAGIPIRSGRVEFEAMGGSVAQLRKQLDASRFATRLLDRWETRAAWNLPVAYRRPPSCFHGGAFFDAIGVEFDDLSRRKAIINADVLDAWFPPSSRVLRTLSGNLSWISRTSPPTGCEGMVRAIARARVVPAESVLPGSGSSDLIFLAFPKWLGATSRALVLDPTYGEYLHVLEKVVGCCVDRLPLERRRNYRVDLAALGKTLERGAYDLVVIVNPNSPTGQLISTRALREIISAAPERTRFWIDETYLDYADGEASLEGFAAASRNTVVCKSLSKAYALSGLRAGYLVAAPPIVEELRASTPPWDVSLPAQIAAVAALGDPNYYRRRHRQTTRLRKELQRELEEIPDLEVVPGLANFLLFHLPIDGPTAEAVVSHCRQKGLFLRDASAMGSRMGRHAIRIAVKDRKTNRRMIWILRDVLERASMPAVASGT